MLGMAIRRTARGGARVRFSLHLLLEPSKRQQRRTGGFRLTGNSESASRVAIELQHTCEQRSRGSWQAEFPCACSNAAYYLGAGLRARHPVTIGLHWIMPAAHKRGHIMIVRSLLRLNSRRRLAGYLSMLAILGLPFAVPALAQTLPTSPAPQANQPPSAETLKNWRGGMAQTPPAKNGCFTSTYPSTQWQEVPCTTAPALPYPPARGPRPGVVGNGNDVSASVSGHISTAIGSFDSVTGVT